MNRGDDKRTLSQTNLIRSKILETTRTQWESSFSAYFLNAD